MHKKAAFLTKTGIRQGKMKKNAGKKPGTKKVPKVKFSKLGKEKPQKPSFMSRQAKVIWDELINDLMKINAISKIDSHSFMLYCESVATYKKAKKEVEKTSEIVENKKNGAMYRNPWLDVMITAQRDMERFQQYFGLHPSSRADRKNLPPSDEPKNKFAGI